MTLITSLGCFSPVLGVQVRIPGEMFGKISDYIPCASKREVIPPPPRYTHAFQVKAMKQHSLCLANVLPHARMRSALGRKPRKARKPKSHLWERAQNAAATSAPGRPTWDLLLPENVEVMVLLEDCRETLAAGVVAAVPASATNPLLRFS